MEMTKGERLYIQKKKKKSLCSSPNRLTSHSGKPWSSSRVNCHED